MSFDTLRSLVGDKWPNDLIDSQGGVLLEKIVYNTTSYSFTTTPPPPAPDKWKVSIELKVLEETKFTVPKVPGIKLVAPVGQLKAELVGHGTTSWHGTLRAESAIVQVDSSVFNLSASTPPLELKFTNPTFTVASTGEFGISADTTITLSGGDLLPAPVTITGHDFYASFEHKILAVGWQTGNILALLPTALAQLLGPFAQSPSTAVLQIVAASPRWSARLDWTSTNTPSFAPPGIKLTAPASTTYSLLFDGGSDEAARHVALGLTLSSGTINASTNFAWGRDEARELHNDENRDPSVAPLFALELTAKKAVTLIAFDIALAGGGAPRYMRQLTTPLPKLDFASPATLQSPANFADSVPLNGGDWSGVFKVNLGTSFTFPFLKQAGGNASGQFEQFIQLDTPPPAALPVNFATASIAFPIGVTLQFGPIKFSSKIQMEFGWETFGIKIDHDKGLDLLYDTPTFTPPEHLGLTWNIKGAPNPMGGGFRYFTLATKNYNYQIQLATGASIELDFTRASQEPITFSVTDFALTPKGINLTASVTDRPARLNGLETRFRFQDSRFIVRENRIADFTISGAGPLPPALVGDSMADISLQFSQQPGGNLTLVAGAARLRGSKLLHCRSTRFQFSIDALGLKFVNDGKFHLYFTLTGSAEFKLEQGDDREGALALLPEIKIDMVDCPLTGNAKVIARHVKFLIELPRPKTFKFLGCFEMELRAIGFVPQAEQFDGDGAMLLSGQLKFAQGAGDVINARIDLHNLLIGLPKPGDFVPRIYFKELAVDLAFGEAFKLHGVVTFEDEADVKGFGGEGELTIQGLPTIRASFAFLRVRRSESDPWLRAWFIYIEVGKLSLRIPVIEIYIREVGLGFGYRFTLVSIAAADRANDIRKLLQELTALSRTQGNLSKREAWAVDLEEAGQDPRWTIVLRALISQTSASASPLEYIEAAEKELPCIFLFDAVIAFRSDFTFFMAIRVWFNTNYADFLKNADNLRDRPFASGFVLLSPRQKRFLAHFASNPNGLIGDHPPLPEFVKSAIQAAQFSVTLLIEPGLFHYEMGWPNMLRWKMRLGPLEVDIRGGFIFRVTESEIVQGSSYQAQGKLEIEGELDLGLVGVRVSASASVAYGARYIGVIGLDDPLNDSAIYGAIGLEINIRLSIELWIKIPLIFTTIKKSFNFSLNIGFTAGLEAGVTGLSLDGFGLRGTGTLSISAMGHDLQLSVKLGINEDAVDAALKRTQQFLSLGLEATEVEGVPGLDGGAAMASEAVVTGDITPKMLVLPGAAGSGEAFDFGETSLFSPATGPFTDATLSSEGFSSASTIALSSEAASLAALKQTELYRTQSLLNWLDNVKFSIAAASFVTPGYNFFVVPASSSRAGSSTIYLVLLPQGQTVDPASGFATPERGFLPTPPASGVAVETDFRLNLKRAGGDYGLEHFNPITKDWDNFAAPASDENLTIDWRANWEARVATAKAYDLDEAGNIKDPTGRNYDFSLREYLTNAYNTETLKNNAEHFQLVAVSDPEPLVINGEKRDERVYNPSDNSFEAAVRGAVEQFQGSPYFKRDPNSEYEQNLEAAFQDTTTIYNSSGKLDDKNAEATRQAQQLHQTRSLIIHDLVNDLRTYAATGKFADTSIAFQMGLVFRLHAKLDADGQPQYPAWLYEYLDSDNPDEAASIPTLKQRLGAHSTTLDDTAATVRTFNINKSNFALNPPQFQRVQQLTSTSTIALAWDLTWEDALHPKLLPAQNDPEHHLLNYQVRRRTLGGNERELTYTLKNSDVLHRPAPAEGEESLVTSIKTRFKLVDHFTNETLEDQAALPSSGRSYVYTITPVDFAGNLGRPLTLIATRYPSEPPRVPVDGELVVNYRVSSEVLEVASATTPTNPRLIVPQQVHLEWSEPQQNKNGPFVPVAKYVLVFRKEHTLPIGSYGLDSTTQGSQAKSLPTTNARPLPTDLRIELNLDDNGLKEVVGREGQQIRACALPLDDLKKIGLWPAGEVAGWQPRAWRMYFQTVSVNGVPSALAPVQLLLRLEGDTETAANASREERRPNELEWLPYPIRFPLLPPPDQEATPGPAHFPMPKTANKAGVFTAAHFDPDLSKNIAYGEHPAGLRAIEFRWNQGPSDRADYPLDLNAGFQLLELDVDAHTNQTFTDSQRLGAALKTIQEVQLISAEDLLLLPGNTLNTNQWEAWYPSAMLRYGRGAKSSVVGSQNKRTPWFSWRDSYLKWPSPDINLNSDQPKPARHSVLQGIIDRLIKGPVGGKSYKVDLQILPPRLPNDFADFQRNTAPASDPYGWAVLQRLGLSVTFSLRDSNTNALVTGQNLLNAVQTVLTDLGINKAHLFVELLFQPGQSIKLKPVAGSADGLLGLIQLSLRPLIEQYRYYYKLAVRGQAKTKLDVATFVPTGENFSFINQSNSAAGQLELVGGETTVVPFELPLNGETVLLWRAGPNLPAVSLSYKIKVKNPAALSTAPFNSFVTYDNTVGQEKLTLLQSLSGLNATDQATFRAAVGDEQKAAELLALTAAKLTAVPVYDEYSTYFNVNNDELAARFSNSLSPQGIEWATFKKYVEGLNAQPLPSGAKFISLPTSEEGIKSLLPDFLSWSQRFFDHADDGVPVTTSSPWVATAYPRAGTPAHACPDKTGRLTYDHLLADKWAHNYRYYFRPYGRYDLLWQNLRQSPAFAPAPDTTTGPVIPLQKLPPELPDPHAGGLDVVLERTQPVDMPLILSSRRLDEASTPAKPPVPGPTWEVIVAQHPEQSLIERNQTLSRQLAFRQIAFSLLRRFAYPEWLSIIRQLSGSEGEIEPLLIENIVPELPETYPSAPEAIDLTAPLDDATARSLDLPERVSTFQPGALVLQWEALPFYYEHKLMVIAQTDSTVSPVNSVVQRDFEYVSPLPSGFQSGFELIRRLPPPFEKPPATPLVRLRERYLSIPLQSLWQSLPAEAQSQWDSESLALVSPTETRRSFASLPDLEVVYQLVEVQAGNIEVQAEISLGQNADGVPTYQVRQLGRHFLADVVAVRKPTTPQGDYQLDVLVLQVSEIPLSVNYISPPIASPTASKIAFNGKVLSLAGVLDQTDLNNLQSGLNAADGAAVQKVYDDWWSEDWVGDPTAEPLPVGDLLELVIPATTRLSWLGELDATEKAALLALEADDLFKVAIQSLIDGAEGAKPGTLIGRAVPPGLNQLPDSLKKTISFTQNPSNRRYTQLKWLGNLSDSQLTILEGWLVGNDYKTVLDKLLAAFEARELSVPRPVDITPPELDEVLAAQLTFTATKIVWHGRCSDAARTALNKLTDKVSEPLKSALNNLRSQVLSTLTPLTVEIDVAGRPTQADLVGLLKAKLLIGGLVLRYHGLMTTQELKQLEAIWSTPPEKAAIARLYAASLQKGLRGGRLEIRTRRGSARPSQLQPLGTFRLDTGEVIDE